MANDNSKMKRDCYVDNWKESEHFKCKDVNLLSVSDLPGQADLAWASFPCQDLSLAGKYAGIGNSSDVEQTRSGAFWGFWKLMQAKAKIDQLPSMIVLENVYGILTANGGEDFRVLGDALAALGYRIGALLIDAVHFLPQSRPRVFIVGCIDNGDLERFVSDKPLANWHPQVLQTAHLQLGEAAKNKWVWWNLKAPPKTRAKKLEDIVSDTPTGVSWHTAEQTTTLIDLMSKNDREKLHLLQRKGQRVVATVYKRTRQGQQRAELRIDGIAGCLRTPGGGSSRQIVMIVQGKSIRSRLLSPREAALLMGLRKTFKLPPRYNDAYHVAGDGVAVPAVRHLAKNLLTPIAITKETSAVSIEDSEDHDHYQLEAAE